MAKLIKSAFLAGAGECSGDANCLRESGSLVQVKLDKTVQPVDLEAAEDFEPHGVWERHNPTDDQGGEWCAKNPIEGGYKYKHTGGDERKAPGCGDAHCCRRKLNMKELKQNSHGGVQVNFPLFDKSRHHIMILTSPKTASTSLEAGFEQCMKMAFFDEKASSYPRGARTHKGSIAADFMMKTGKGDVVWMIMATRHIFSHAVSSYFQTSAVTFIENRSEFLNMSMEEKQADFEQGNHGYGYNWLQDDFEATINADVTKFKFSPPQLRLQKMWRGRQLNVVVVRVEDIAQWNTTLKQDFPCFNMQAKNTGSKKWYQEAYEQFKDSYHPDKSLLEEMNRKDKLTMFYSKAEQANFMKTFLNTESK